MTNLQVINTIHTINNNKEDLFSKRLPIKVLFALKRNITKFNSAADDYRSTLATLCEQHDVDPAELNGSIKPELMAEINALLTEDADVAVAMVPVSLLEQCGDAYDALNYAELEALEFMLEDDE